MAWLERAGHDEREKKGYDFACGLRQEDPRSIVIGTWRRYLGMVSHRSHRHEHG